MTIVFSEPVTGFTITSLSLVRGSTSVPLTSAQTLTSTDQTTFTLNGLSSLTTADGDYTLTLAAAGITDVAGNALASGANSTFTVDATAPTVSSVGTTETSNSKFKTGGVIHITVTFNEPIFITGAPEILLNSGPSGADAFAENPVKTGPATLTFTYTVAAGENANPLDYKSISSLVPNGGTIKDAAGNDATLTLPTPATTNDQLATAALVVDTAPPTVTVAPNPNVTNNNLIGLAGTVSDGAASSGIQSSMTVVITGVTNTSFTRTVTGTATSTGWSADLGATTLPDGTYTLTAHVTDVAGNEGIGTGSLTVDTADPVVTVTTASTGDTTPVLTGTISDPAPSSGIQSAMTLVITGISDPSFTLNVDGTATATGWTATVPAGSELPVGTYHVTATVTDNATNSGSSVDDDSVNLTITAANSTLSGFVYLDPANSGVRVASGKTKTGIPGVTITLKLKQTDGTFATVGDPVTTDANGAYTFTGLADGTYQIVETQPSSLAEGKVNPGLINGTANGTAQGNDTITSIVLAADQNGTEYNFAELGLTSDNVSKRQFLGSTPSTADLLAQFVGGTSNSSAVSSNALSPHTAIVTNSALPSTSTSSTLKSSTLSAGEVTSHSTAKPTAATKSTVVTATPKKTTATVAPAKKSTKQSTSLVDQVLASQHNWLRAFLGSSHH
jgi:hypothetical protein